MIPKSGTRFSDQIMRHFITFARAPQIRIRNLRKLDCAAKPVPTFADRALLALTGFFARRETLFSSRMRYHTA
jgi:hypothetical protein